MVKADIAGRDPAGGDETIVESWFPQSNSASDTDTGTSVTARTVYLDSHIEDGIQANLTSRLAPAFGLPYRTTIWLYIKQRTTTWTAHFERWPTLRDATSSSA